MTKIWFGLGLLMLVWTAIAVLALHNVPVTP
jgi:hypothetical protein